MILAEQIDGKLGN